MICNILSSCLRGKKRRTKASKGVARTLGAVKGSCGEKRMSINQEKERGEERREEERGGEERREIRLLKERGITKSKLSVINLIHYVIKETIN